MSANSTQRGKWLVRGIIFVGALLIVLIVTAIFPLLSKDANYVSRLQGRVAAELPVGSPEPVVDQWLRINTKFIPTRSAPYPADTVDGRQVIELAGVPREQIGSVISTTVPREDVISNFKEDYVRIYFFFDKQGKLLDTYFLRWADIVWMENEAD